jgi:hypothetical protein
MKKSATNNNVTAQEMARNLMKVPKKDKGDNMPTIYNPFPNTVHQADLLTLPTDKGFKYLLVVVDVSTHKLDAEPLKKKTNDKVLDGFIKIYSRKILKLPKRLEVDSGSEFKGVVNQYFKNNEIAVRRGKPGRHRQQAMVERYNQIIGI